LLNSFHSYVATKIRILQAKP